MSGRSRLDAFVVAAPGLEALLLDELTRLDVRPARAVKGGVECSVTWPQLWAVHLRSRLATRVLVRVWRFRATTWGELEAGLKRVQWGEWLADDAVLDVQATCSKSSALYHSDAVAERAAAVIGSSCESSAPPGNAHVPPPWVHAARSCSSTSGCSFSWRTSSSPAAP